MEYIPRKLEPILIDYLQDDLPRGVIIAGLIGVGKTTLITHALQILSREFKTFNYTGDDIQFRRSVAEDTRFLIKDIRSKTNERALIYVDEIQKTPEILDALKLAHDEENMSFIVSGSEPGFLIREVNHRLQRRAMVFHLFPLSINEIYSNQNMCEEVPMESWNAILNGVAPDHLLDVKGDWQDIYEDFSRFRATGTIPLVYREKTLLRKRQALASIIERGYYPINNLTQEQFDIIQTELARLNNREFAYQTIFRKTRINRRDKINAAINYLMDQGMLTSKRRKLFHEARLSYHVIYSFVDAGLASYLQRGDKLAQPDNGYDLESLVFSQLRNLNNISKYPLNFSYFTPYYVTPSGQVKYKDGEIDFLMDTGSNIIPVEVKATAEINRIDISILKTFMKEQNVPFGIVFYQGAPWVDKTTQLYYLPIALL